MKFDYFGNSWSILEKFAKYNHNKFDGSEMNDLSEREILAYKEDFDNGQIDWQILQFSESLATLSVDADSYIHKALCKLLNITSF